MSIDIKITDRKGFDFTKPDLAEEISPVRLNTILKMI